MVLHSPTRMGCTILSFFTLSQVIPFLHLKPLLQNIVYPEAINEIKALTDAYDAEQAAAAAGGAVEVEGLA